MDTLFEMPPIEWEAVVPELYRNGTLEPITTKEGVDELLPRLLAAPLLAVDVETTGLDFKRAQLHGVSIADADGEWYVCGEGMFHLLPALVEMSQDPGKTFVLHNAKFDLHFLVPHGFRPINMVDTLVAQWLVDENLELGLKSLAYTRLNYQGELLEFKDMQRAVKRVLKKKKMEDVTVYDIPVEVFAKYAATDTRLTYDLWKLLQYDLDQEGMTQIFYEIEMPFVWILFQMEENGMYINQAGVAELEAELVAERDRLQEKWDTLSNKVNDGSSQQLGHYLFDVLGLPEQDKTKTGQAKVDDLVLSRLEKLDESGAVKTLRELRTVKKLISTYVVFMTEQVINGRIHGSFNHTGAATGRLSSSDPNLQNIPSRGELGKKIRKLFGAPPGYVIVDVDYSQIELRLTASDANEQNFIMAFENGEDPHQMTADRSNVTRPIGKTLNFSTLYGAGPRKLCDTIEASGHPRPKESEAREWLNAFQEAYPAIVRWKKAIVTRGRELGYVPTYGGRKRRLPDLNSWDDELRSRAERQGPNARIQGSAADLIKWATVQLEPFLEWYGAKLVAQVHDELVFEVPEEVAEEFSAYASQIMASVKEHFKLRVPIIAEGHIGPTWGDTH